MKKSTTYKLVTFYKFVDIANPEEVVKEHKQFCSDIGMKGRIYIGEEGINAQVTVNKGQMMAYRLYLESTPYFKNIPDIDEKAQPVPEHQFPKMIVRYRQEIVALGKIYSSEAIKNATHKITPEEFKHLMDSDADDYVVLDMRNNYEYKLGHFKNAIPAGTLSFREWHQQMDAFKAKYGHKKIVMYCTGGIRCEKLGAMLEEENLPGVMQLDGGVIKYVNQFNDGNWLGNLYTFDGRVSTKVGDQATHTIISRCHYTDEPTEEYHNCRYGPCNAQLIAKPKEYRKHLGFCSEECAKKGGEDLLIKNADFDPMDYKGMRIQIKLNPDLKEGFIEETQRHLRKWLHEVEFNHKTPVAEEIIPIA